MAEDFDFEMDFCRGVLRHDRDNVAAMEMLAHFCTRAGQIDEGLEWDRRIVELKPDNPFAHYNLACSLSLKNRLPDAVAALQRALEAGYSDVKWMLEDPDLLPLQDYPPFGALLAQLQKPD